MAEFFFAVAAIVLLTVALGLFRIFLKSGEAERLMSAQLLGSGGVAVLLLVGVAMATPAIIDVALVLALLAAFASVAFVNEAASSPAVSHDGVEGP